MAYVKPQVLVFQELRAVPAETLVPLRPHISGPNAILHRYSDAEEKALINVGEYDRLEETSYLWPGRAAGSKVDVSYVKLYADDALLMYFEDTIGSGSTITAVSGRTNRVKSSSVSFKTNGAAYPRSASLYDRDVKVGDRVQVRCVSEDDDCEETILNTYVTGFASDNITATVEEDAREDEDNIRDTTASVSIEKVGGADNCITATVVDPSDYDDLLEGNISETYTIEVVKSSVAGCNAARLRVTSASGTDDQAEVTPADFGDATAIGTRGLEVIFDLDTGDCEDDADTAGVEANEFVVGQKWVVEVTQDFAIVFAQGGGTYTGDANDTYIVEVTKGGLWADLPEITVTTVKGLDFSGPTPVTDSNLAVNIGTHGVTISFYGESGDPGASASLSFDSPVAGLRKGDKFYITVTSASAGPVRQLILKDNLPAAMLAASDLDLRLFIVDDIEITANRLGAAPLTNWETEATQLTVAAGVTSYHPEWTNNGTQLPLPLWGGTLFIHYREWVTDLCDVVGTVSDETDFDDIPGQLDPDNPLKWGVHMAWLNSNGTAVKYTAVCDPDDLDSWSNVLERVVGRDDLYNLVPLTFTKAVQDAYAAHADAESSPEAGNWKATFVALQAVENKAIVSDATSSDDEIVLATLSDNPQASGTQYTLLQVPAGNGKFITNGVRPKDTVRYLYTVDGFGAATYTEFVVDTVISEDALVLLTGHSVAVNEPQKIEIWHALTKTELATQVAQAAGAFSNRRVCAVWPDILSNAGVEMPGYFGAAAVAGLVGGVVPQQALTNISISGFDSAARSKEFFNSSQLDTLAESGVWIITQSAAGEIYTRHGLTTDVTDLSTRSEMRRRNLDSLSYQSLNQLADLIGRANVTPSLIELLTWRMEALIKTWQNQGATQLLGGQVISGTVRSIRQHPILLDRVEIILDLVMPYEVNNIELYLVA